MDAGVWGPPLWALLHMSAHAVDALPARRRPAAARMHDDLLACLEQLLPCRYCRESLVAFRGALRRAGCRFSGRAGYVWALHNMVNQKLWIQNRGRQPFEPFTRVAADRKWGPAAAVRLGSPPALLGALQVVAYNFERTGAEVAVLHRLVERVAGACELVPELAPVAAALRARRARLGRTGRSAHAALTGAMRAVSGYGETSAQAWRRTARARVG